MNTFKFAVDKERSLQIMEEILSHLKSDNDVIYHENFDCCNYYDYDDDDDEVRPNVVLYRHKLGIVEVQLDWEEFKRSRNLSDHYVKLMNITKENWTRSDQIEIYEGSEIDTDKVISLNAYLHETSAECDVSYPNFSYDIVLQCWVTKDDFSGAKNGINCNGEIMILDFTDYLE